MNSIILLVLLLTYIGATKHNEGPSEFLKVKWRQAYDVLTSFHNSSRCVLSCDHGAAIVFWKNVVENAVKLLSKSSVVENLSDAYSYNSKSLENHIRGNITIAIQSFDLNQNGFISEEEYYRAYLCLGYGMEKLKKGFNLHHPVDKGIPVSDYIEAWVEYGTEPDKAKEIYRLFDEIEEHLIKT